jgi:large-conductance mechanosensitive channel
MEIFNILDTANSTLCEGVLIPNELFNLSSTIVNLIKVAVPILLIIFGMLDFAKAIIAKKEDDVKKYQKAFVSRVISAVIVFLIIFIVQTVVNLISGVEDKTNSDGQTISDTWSCSRKFINGINNSKSKTTTTSTTNSSNNS